MSDDMLSSKEAAEVLGIPCNSVQHWTNQGWITPRKMMTKAGGRCYRQFFLRSEMEWRRDNPPIYEPKPRKHREYDKSPTREDCIYLAGFCDGEGSVHIRERDETKSLTYTLMITLTNTYHPVLEWVHETFGGALANKPACERDKERAENWRSCRQWQASANEAMTILKLIRPYLRVKHIQADLAIEFQEHMTLRHRGRWHRMTPEEAAWRSAQREKISALNGRRGVQYINKRRKR